MRTHEALLAAGVESHVLTLRDEDASRHVYKANRSLLCRIWNSLLCRLRLLPQARYRHMVVNTSGLSFPQAVYDISSADLVKEADIIHLHWACNFFDYASFFKKCRKPIVWTLHDQYPFMGIVHYDFDLSRKHDDAMFLRIENRMRKKKERIYARNNNMSIVCLSSWMRESSAQYPAFCNRPHHIIRNCIDIDVYNVQNRPSSGGKKRLLFLASSFYNRIKGFDLLVAAMKDFPVEVELVCVGGRGDMELSGAIQLGRISEEAKLAEVYRSVDAFILPSRQDNLPNTMLESLCCGTPVISFALGGMLDIIQHGKNGLFADDVSPEALRAAILQFLANGVEWSPERISQEARAMFNPARIAGDYIGLYSKLLSKED